MDVIEIDGLRIAYRRAGRGPALVLLHGGLSDSREWRRQIDALGDEWTVVAWDAPGCGRSDDPPGWYRLPDYADRLAALVEALAPGPAHLVGLSFGAGLALELSGRRPDLARSLVLAAGYPGWRGWFPPEVVAERVEAVLREAELPAARLVPLWLPQLLTAAAPAGAAAELAEIMAGVRPAGARTMARAFAEADLREVLPRIAVPTLLLHGDADRRAPLALAEELHARIPDSELVVLAGVGHQANMDAPDRFTAEVRRFLRALEDATAAG